jgi:hypothetical protein
MFAANKRFKLFVALKRVIVRYLADLPLCFLIPSNTIIVIVEKTKNCPCQ